MAKSRGFTICKTCWVLSNTTYIALGSNLGDSVVQIQNAFGELQIFSRSSLARSSLWRSAPVGCPPDSPDFINAVVELEPLEGETPESLLTKLQALEVKFGRKPKEVLNEPRPLDLDIIAFGDEACETPQLTLPHPRWYQRRFVLEPLSEIAPDAILPGQSQPVIELLSELDTTEVLVRL